MLARLARPLCLFALAAVVLGYRAEKPGVAEVFSDPVSHIRAQDESGYANAALRMASSGGWLTPRYLGRYWLIKPPLVIWLAALSMKVWGISLWALRIPVVLAGALATLLLLFWPGRMHSWWSIATTGFLLAADPLWHIFSRLCYTDMLLAAAAAGALFVFQRDALFSRRSSIGWFAFAVAAGVMAKSVAGLLPVIIVVLCYVLTRRRPPAGFWTAVVAALLLVAPWHLYEAIAHGRWLWSDYVQVQLLGFGFRPPAQAVAESPLVFYGKRLLITDPVLTLLALTALPALLRAARGRQPEAMLLVSWAVVMGAAVLSFRYRNLPYLLQLIAPLCLVATGYSPLLGVRRGRLAAAALAALFCLKVVVATPAWAIPYSVQAPLPSTAGLHWYAGLSRSNELIAVDTDDEFTASVMGIAKVRYAFIDPDGVAVRYAPHYAYLGITLTEQQFEDLGRLKPEFRRRLAAWGLDDGEPVGTTIAANSAGEVLRILATHPNSDFYLPEALRGQIPEEAWRTHRMEPLATGRFFLLARQSSPAPTTKPALE